MAHADLLHVPTWTKRGTVRVVVESPKGSAVKFDYDPELDVFAYGKSLVLGLNIRTVGGSSPEPVAKTETRSMSLCLRMGLLFRASSSSVVSSASFAWRRTPRNAVSA